MTQTATVRKLIGDKAEIEVQRMSACAHNCAECGGGCSELTRTGDSPGAESPGGADGRPGAGGILLQAGIGICRGGLPAADRAVFPGLFPGGRFGRRAGSGGCGGRGLFSPVSGYDDRGGPARPEEKPEPVHHCRHFVSANHVWICTSTQG